MSAPPTELGAYFLKSDYASFLRRTAVVIIDVAVLWLAWLIIAYGIYFADPAGLSQSAAPAVIWYFFIFFYLVILERSPYRTVGFRICKVRIVGISGNQPGIFNMTFRFIMLFIGPFHPLVDLIWLSGDPCKQALRDKFGATFVVRHDAKPVGYAPIVYNTYYLFGIRMIFREVPIPGGI